MLPATLVACLSVTMLSAAELRGPQLIDALNGKSFSCTYKKSTMKWVFEKSDPNGRKFPYVVTLDGKTYEASYRMLKNGKVEHSQTNKGRKIVQQKDGSLTVSGKGVPTTHCKPL
jgi:hypothetical protein